MRNVEFANGEFYHVYNQGVDGRNITMDKEDSDRFVQSMIEFNSSERIGSIFEHSFTKVPKSAEPLVNVIAYCLNPNHFHMVLEQLMENGISKFFHCLSGGYTKYFNNKYKRRGALFQGPFKAKYIFDNNYLLHASVYVNLNNRVHQLGTLGSKLVRSSWREYESGNFSLCKPSVAMEQFDSSIAYQGFAFSALQQMVEKRPEYEELKHLEP